MKKEVLSLRIRPLLPPPEKRKISFRLPLPTVDTFQSYLAAYAETYGVDPDPDFVADQIFTTFFDSDRAFAAYLQKTGIGKDPEDRDTGISEDGKHTVGSTGLPMGR